MCCWFFDGGDGFSKRNTGSVPLFLENHDKRNIQPTAAPVSVEKPPAEPVCPIMFINP
jgi:hypothetical protein